MEDFHKEDVAQEEGSKEEEGKVKKEDVFSQKALPSEPPPPLPESERENREIISGVEEDVDAASGEDELQETTAREADEGADEGAEDKIDEGAREEGESEAGERTREGTTERSRTKIGDLHLAPDEKLSVFSSRQIASFITGAILIALLVGGLGGFWAGWRYAPKRVLKLVQVKMDSSPQRESTPAFPDKDIPGEDISDIPRPPDTVRTLFDFSPHSSSVRYAAPGDKSEAYMTFFSEQMPSLGWKLLKAQKQKGSVSMNFQKGKSTAQIDIIYFSGTLGIASQVYSKSHTQVDIRKTH